MTPKYAAPPMSNATYDFLKWVAQIVLPAVGALYFSLSEIWHLPYATEFVGTITVIDVFLGVVLGLSSSRYVNSEAAFDGELVVDTSSLEKDKYTLKFNGAIDDIANKDKITFRVSQ